jgi:hypothetical protein
MKFPSIHSVSPLEVVLFVVFVLYLIFPVQTPSFLTQYINSNIGIAIIIILTLYMLFYTTPILAILTVFIAYELLRRSHVIRTAGNHLRQPQRSLIEHNHSQWKKDVELKKMNPPVETTLEEQVISMMAPLGKSESVSFLDAAYSPNQDRIAGASMISS